jgi:hypothetical protein
MNKKIDAKKKKQKIVQCSCTDQKQLHADDVNQRRQRTLTSRSNTHSASVGVHNGKRKNPFGHSHLSILYIYIFYINDPFIDEKKFHCKTR